MALIESIQKSIDFIEENLKNDISLFECARAAGYSLYHYCRIFQLSTGLTVMDYIRIRRLSNAAIDICETDKSIKEIAFDWGFNSHEQFIRAFNKSFAISPSMYRKSKYCIDLFQKKTLEDADCTDTIIQYMHIDPEIIMLPSFKIAGQVISTSWENGKHIKDIPRFLNKYYADRLWEVIPDKIEDNARIDYGLVSDFGQDGLSFNYTEGVEVSSCDNLPSYITAKMVPEGYYAKFTSPPANKFNFIGVLQSFWKYIELKWLPNSDYIHAGTHEIITYCPEKNKFSKDLYIPIVKKD